MLATLLHSAMARAGHAVRVVGTGRDAALAIRSWEPAAVILDLLLPDTDGLDVVNTARREGNDVPMMILTGRDDLQTRLQGFQAGADDFLVKPFAVEELLARLGAITRRGHSARSDRLTVGPLNMNRSAREVRLRGEIVSLSPREYSLLECFMIEPNRVFSRDELLTKVWDESEAAYANVVDVTVGRLRRALANTRLILTVRGAGYKLSSGTTATYLVETASG
jgi:DNA-binding response OmpR family regulator